MPVDVATVTDAQLAELKLLVPFTTLPDDQLRQLLADDTCPVPVLLSNQEPQRYADGRVLTKDTVDPYGVASTLWEREAIALEAAAANSRAVVKSETNGDVSRTYGDPTGRTATSAWAMARRLRRRSLCPGKRAPSARVVDVLPPNYARGYVDPSDPTTWPDPQLQEPTPVDLAAPYVINRPEPQL